jgi:hypothetical protein
MFITCSLALAQIGCSGLRQMTALSALRNSISQRFRVEDVRVDLPGPETLVISLTNTGIEDSGEEAKRSLAQRVAEFARANYREAGTVDHYWVMFLTMADDSLINNSASIRGTYLFNKEAKPQPIPGPTSDRTAVKPKVTTTIRNNETTVSASSILLYGNQAPDGTTRNGMQLLPHFTLSGSKQKAPQSVELDLAAFSAEPVYGPDHSFNLTADGVLLAQGTAQFVSSGKINDGQTAEFMSIKISYANFQKLAQSETATLKLGSAEIDFAADQLRILKEMTLVAESARLKGTGDSER